MVELRPRLRVAERRYMDITVRGLQQGRHRQHVSEGWRGHGPRGALPNSRIVNPGGDGILIEVGGWE